MRHFRRRTEFGGLALVALAVQLGLSFGHVHTEGRAFAARAVSASTPLACRTITRPAPEQRCPERNPADSGCAICFTIAQAGAVVLPEPPAVPPPAPVAASLGLERSHAAVHDVKTASFEPRGPPTSRA